MSSLSLPEILASAGLPASVGAVIDLPPGTPDWVRILFMGAGVIGGPALLKLAQVAAPRILAGRRAKKKSLAESKRRRRQQLLEDGDKTNDGLADKLADEADALDAEAAELDALSGSTKRDVE
jgi:hypothetical protein